jgi:hypothetical protein
MGVIDEKKEKKTMSWKRYERLTARRHRGRHVGGPGKPDYVRGSARGEVKDLNRPVTRTEVIEARKKGVTEICSKKGFTEPAINHVSRYNMKMKLFYRRRRVL